MSNFTSFLLVAKLFYICSLYTDQMKFEQKTLSSPPVSFPNSPTHSPPPRPEKRCGWLEYIGEGVEGIYLSWVYRQLLTLSSTHPTHRVSTNIISFFVKIFNIKFFSKIFCNIVVLFLRNELKDFSDNQKWVSRPISSYCIFQWYCTVYNVQDSFMQYSK